MVGSRPCEEAGIHLVRNLTVPTAPRHDRHLHHPAWADDELMTLWDAPVHTPALRRGC